MAIKEFSGFPSKARFTPIPNLFFSSLLPQIEDINELKLTLHLFWLLYQKRGSPRFVTLAELLGDKTLMSGLEAKVTTPAQALVQSLDRAVARGSFLHIKVKGKGDAEDIYFLNTESGRRDIVRVKNGEVELGAPVVAEEFQAKERPNIFSLYEQNIGILTPLIAEELKEAERTYPPSWIEAAFREAISLNRRNWRYILRILERWAVEGKDNGKPGRDSKTGLEPKEYLAGRYGPLIRH